MPNVSKETLLLRSKNARRKPTKAEGRLWAYLVRRDLAWKFYKQKIFGPYYVDFVNYEHKLIIEIDGGIHKGREDYDNRRTSYLESLGYRVVRFTNEQVLEDTDSVIDEILRLAPTDPCYMHKRRRYSNKPSIR